MGAFLRWIPDSGGPSRALYFDVCTSEGQTFTATATENPVETGVNVSDHVKRELDRVALDVMVSNAPIDDLNGRGANMNKIALQIEEYKAPFAPTPGAVFAAVGGAVKSAVGALLGSGKTEYAAQVLTWDSTFDAVADTLAVLQKLQDDGQLVTIVLPSKEHKNMMLETIGITRDGTTGDAATFSLAFKQLRRVEAKLVAAPASTEVRGQPKKPKGAKDPKETEKPYKSILSGLLGR